MNGIHEANKSFDFNKIVYNKPVQVVGGNHFIKFKINDLPLYIQPPKCLTKQSVLKTKKKLFCDLMFTNENDEFINWIENLEANCLVKLFENREKWFDTELDKDDIENFFTSSIKVYKSGKFYTIRANIPTIMDKCSLKIYDEDEIEVELENIQENTNIITIIEFQGIRCSSRNFQIEIEIKQILIMKPVDLFEKCILKNDLRINNNLGILNKSNNQTDTIIDKLDIDKPDIDKPDIDKPDIDKPDIDKPDIDKPDIDKPDIDKPDIDKSDILEIEIDLDKLNDNEPMQLTNRNQVYYEMYKEARQKAKNAKRLSIISYLEAKRIKNTYLLDDIEESEDSENEV